MSLEMRKYYVGIVVGKMSTDQIAVNANPVCDGNLYGSIFIKNLEGCNFGVAAVFSYLIMLRSRSTGTGVCSIAFNNRGIQRLNQVFDQIRCQVV